MSKLIGSNGSANASSIHRKRHIADCFKLYPWEWMVREAFGTNLLLDNTRWLEAQCGR